MAKRGTQQKKEIIARALIDPAFRRTLLARPEKVFGKPLSKADALAVARFKKMVPHLSEIVGGLASDILCTGGGGCGGSVAV